MPRPTSTPMEMLIQTFRKAAQRVPAYQTLLAESGIRPEDINTIEDFRRLPILDKTNTFQRFRMHELSLDGELGPIRWVLTSSGQSGMYFDSSGSGPSRCWWRILATFELTYGGCPVSA